MTETVDKEVLVLYSLTKGASRIFYCCKKCKEVLAEGVWALTGTIDGVDYLIGPNPRPTCCGEGRPVPFLFETEGGAQEKLDLVCNVIDEHKNHLVYNYYGKHNFIPKYMN